jgi:hypothetical protein
MIEFRPPPTVEAWLKRDRIEIAASSVDIATGYIPPPLPGTVNGATRDEFNDEEWAEVLRLAAIYQRFRSMSDDELLALTDDELSPETFWLTQRAVGAIGTNALRTLTVRGFVLARLRYLATTALIASVHGAGAGARGSGPGIKGCK